MMFSQKFFSKHQFISSAFAITASIAAVAGFVYAATTIGTNVSVDGNLTVSGTSATTTFSTGGFTVGTSQFVVQQNSGNVGIGTTSPSQKLSVVGNAYISDGIGVGTSNPRPTEGYGFVAQSDTVNGANNIAVVNRAEWSVGVEGYVGTPGFDFYNDTSQALFYLSATGRLPGLCNSINVQQQCYSAFLFTTGNNGLNITSEGTNAAIRFIVDSTNANLFSNERMRITNTGNIGIGTTTPYSRFHVSRGASATTTVNFGEVGSATSKACFNTKNVSGADISFYFNAANALVVESNLCR